jgi:hypothetical protein
VTVVYVFYFAIVVAGLCQWTVRARTVGKTVSQPAESPSYGQPVAAADTLLKEVTV